MARLLRDELIAELIRTDGCPQASQPCQPPLDHLRVWLFNGNTLVRYAIKYQRAGLFRRRQRKVVIVALLRWPVP